MAKIFKVTNRRVFISSILLLSGILLFGQTYTTMPGPQGFGYYRINNFTGSASYCAQHCIALDTDVAGN